METARQQHLAQRVLRPLCLFHLHSNLDDIWLANVVDVGWIEALVFDQDVDTILLAVVESVVFIYI
jgi:hypothetical protein